jgi:hypothetical protein
MLSRLLVALLAAQSPCTQQTDPCREATLIVETVGPLWDTLPGIEVTVTSRDKTRTVYRQITNAEGNACFSVPPVSAYDIDATSSGGFKKARLKKVRIGSGFVTDLAPGQSLAEGTVKNAPPARVQLRMLLSGPWVIFN